MIYWTTIFYLNSICISIKQNIQKQNKTKQKNENTSNNKPLFKAFFIFFMLDCKPLSRKMPVEANPTHEMAATTQRIVKQTLIIMIG